MPTNNRKVVLLVALFFYWLVVNYFVLINPLKLFPYPEQAAHTDISYQASDALTPESLNNLNWENRLLPDDWYKSEQTSDQAWYRSVIPIDDLSTDVWAVYLPSVTHNAAVYINNIWVGQGGSFDQPVSRHHNEPLLFRFSSELLHPGNNQIDIRVKASYHEQGLLDSFYLAPADDLQAAYAWKYFVRVDLIEWVNMAMTVMMLIVFIFWLARPQDSVYGLFALELFFWVVHNLNLTMTSIPVSAITWEALMMCTFGWTIITMVFFNHRYVGTVNKTVEQVLLVVAVLGAGIFFLPDIGSILHIGFGFWDIFMVVFGCYAIAHLLKVYWQRADMDVYLMLLVGLPILVLGLHDILLLNNLWDRRDGLIIQYGAIPAVVLFSWFMVRRFVQSINKAEHLATTLERRVQEKQLALHTQYEELKSMEQQRTLAEERERIMRDMHDGIGGQLVSVIAMLDEYKDDVFIKVREKIQHSLTDLRFVIDSLDPLLYDLPTLLGMMRMRLVDQLDAANIELEWSVTELPRLENMNPRRSLNIMRIVQEAITNSIKHSGSNKMTLATGVLDGAENCIFIDIIDYGTAQSSQLHTDSLSGRGIKNMQYRARQLGAKLDMDFSSNGARIRLVLAY